MGSADFRMIRPVSVTADGAFSRASPKWVFDKAGTLVRVPVDTLAVTYDPGDLSKAPYPVVDLQPVTNLLAPTEDFSVWSNNGSIVAPAFGVAPDGTQTTTRVVGGTKFRGVTLAAGVYAYSLHVRPTGPKISMFKDGAGGSVAITYTIATDSFAVLFGAAAVKGWRAKKLSNGAYRIWMVVDVPAGQSNWHLYPLDDGGASDAEFWGANLVAGEDYSSYIPGATTRAADIIAPGAGLVYSNVPIAERPYAVGATFALNELAYDPVTRKVYKSLIANNTGKAFDDTSAWTPGLATNRWRMLDKAVNSQTSAPELLVTAVKPGALVNTMGLLNVAGSRVTVTQTESYYSQSKSLVRHDVLSWYDFFYEEPIREGDVIFDGIPPYVNSTLIITVENPGATAAIGACLLGKSRTIGQTAWGFTGGVLSYSTTNTDTFGNVTMVRRDNSRVLNFEIYIPKGFESEAYRLLSQYTDVEMLVIGTEDYSMSYSYGYLGQWSVPVTNGEKTAHIEWKGLV